MPFTVRINPHQNAVQSFVIPNATERTDGVMTAAMVRKLNELIPEDEGSFVNVEFFRLAPDKTERTDAETWQAAVDSGLPLSSGQREYEISTGETIINNNSCHAIFCGNTTFRMADGSVINTDGNSDNFTPFMQHRGVVGFWLGGRLIMDGNRGNQTYPATNPNFGRGTTAQTSAGRRFNGIMEFVAGVNNTTPSSDIVIAGEVEVHDAYLNGLVFCQALRVSVLNVYTHDNTVNGISVEGCTTFHAYGTTHIKDGVSTQYPSIGPNGSDGDRAGIQCREVPGTYTAVQLEMPFIPSPNGTDSWVNSDINYVSCSGIDCQVEALFQRMCFPGKIVDCSSQDVGFSRGTASSFHCAHFWQEGGWYVMHGNIGIQRRNNAGAGYQMPDGMVLQTFNGTGAGSGGGVPITYGGTFKSSVLGVRLVCGDTASPGRLPQQNYFRGARIFSECDVSQFYAEGVDGASFILIQNDVNFNLLPPRNVTLRDVRLENAINCDLAIAVARFGSTVGDSPGFVFDNVQVRNVTTTAAGSDDHAFIDFATNMANHVVTASFTNLDFDCTNTGSGFNYNGVRMRVPAGSIMDIHFTNCANGLSPVRASGNNAGSVPALGGFAKLSIRGNMTNCHRCWLIDATNWTANADSFTFDIDATAFTEELFFVTGFTPAGNPTFKMNAVNARYRIDAAALSRTFPAGAGNITTTDDNFFAEAAWYSWGPNNDNYGSGSSVRVYDMKRRFSSVANLNNAKPYYVGETVLTTDTTPNILWYGVTKTGITGLWAQMAIPTP